MSSDWNHIDDDACRRFLSAVDLVGQRWSSAILLALARGATRFTQILEVIPGLSGRLLTARLRQLADDGLVERTVVPTTPVQIRYELTAKGRELLASMQPLVRWGTDWLPEEETEATA